MGLIDSVNRQNRELEELKKQKQLDQIENYKRQKERQKLREQQEELKAYKTDMEEYLKIEFNRYLFEAGSDYITEFYNIYRKYVILRNFFESIAIKKYNTLYIPFKRELENHFDLKYNTILKRCYNEQKQHEKYLLTQQQETETEAEEEQKQPFNWLGLIKISFYIIICLVFLPCALILFILWGALKATK